MMRRRKGCRCSDFGMLAVVLFLNMLLTTATVVTVQDEEEKVVPGEVKVKVGVVFDLDSVFGEMSLSCISMALDDLYSSRSYYKTRIVLHSIDSNDTVVDAAAAALELIKKEEVQAIIGPTSSMQANFIINIGDKAEVPIISFSATRPSLTSHRSSFFFRAAQNDSSQVKAIGAIVKTFKWRQVVPIHSDNEFGEGIIPYLIDALQEVDTDVPYQSKISASARDEQIIDELNNLMKMPTRVFVVHMAPHHASRLFTKAKEIGMMKRGYVWIITDAIANLLDLIDPSVLEAMQGVVGIKTYVPRSKGLDSFKHDWRKRFQSYYPRRKEEDIPEVDVFGLWAYDAAWALAMAVEKAGTDNLRYTSTNITASKMNSTNYLYTLGVNQNGQKLRDAFSNLKFRGLAGEFSLIDGQLQSSLFEIVNVNGNGRRNVGFWSAESGLRRKVEESERSAKGLRSIIWPGERIVTPKGWEIPTNGKKLRIGVPVKHGFREFVSVIRDPKTNATIDVGGYCIDVFKAVIETLPYKVDYEFVPANPNFSYNELTYQVFLGKFDAVVGDITIRANRSSYLDYTLPFTESGVAMVVPMKNSKKTNAWVFLKPLTRDLWFVTAFFFVFVAFVIWILEHRVNEQFRGSPLDQLCTSLWYSFSTMVFAHREVTLNNLTRVVVVVWLFVVLIITQSYTASLASLLTVQDLKPTVTDINQLLKNGDNIGYQDGSFVYEILKSLKFHDSQLKSYESPKEMHQLFTRGSINGGISAALDEIPYIKLFLAMYCSQYTTTEPTYKADGFGFGFPIGSPLVPHISRRILEVTESERMKKIEEKWFKTLKECTASKVAELSSTRLSINSFWALFLITGVASLCSVAFYVGKFLYDERTRWQNVQSPIGERLYKLVGEFMKRDQRAHPLRRRISINGVPFNPQAIVASDDDHPRRD
ncbi:glutamate receptor 2.5-like isoform X2 [Cucumis melo]|uniref:Glutamate receptor n=1 Tax=Cucumis melo TaxID=3656 RepID=A0A1S3BCC4_CUCME|nr:glutamate receptor 2.5-like isoform X2 [Cucumis melo]XP_050938120.1 glutamate receptor 2.5-like isoform X2 [Cucumis melo]XP_050938121.1 glutamate receptor 2.5-like isoform X2 [Cucumis melo]